MTDISARQTFTTAENSRFSDYPGSADTPESGSCIEAHGLTRSTELLADRRNRVTMGRRKARPTRARKLPPSNESHSRNSATAGLCPRRTRRFFGPSFAASLVPHPAPPTPHPPPVPTHRPLRPHSDLHSLTTSPPPRCSQLGAQSHRRRGRFNFVPHTTESAMTCGTMLKYLPRIPSTSTRMHQSNCSRAGQC